MAQSAPARTKINTKVTQPAPGRPSRRPAGRGRPPKGPRVSGDARDSVRQPARPVIELDFGILVYPPETDGEPTGAAFTENGQRKYRQGATEAKLAAKLEKVTERLRADAANMERPGADLITYYLNPDRLPAGQRWSRKHAHTQRRLCERFAAPGHRRGHLPGHQDLPHAADRQRRAHCRRRRPGARDALRAGRSGDRGRVPDQPAAGRCSTPGPRSRRADIAPGSPRPCHRRVPVAAPWPLPWCWPS